MQTFFQPVYKNYWLKYNHIFLIYANRQAHIIDSIRFPQIVQVQTIYKLVPTIVILCEHIHQNIVRFEIRILKIGKYFRNVRFECFLFFLYVFIALRTFRNCSCLYFRELSNNQSSASTVVSGSANASISSHQHQHAIIPSTSPLSQYTSNGDVQILTTTPPRNLSNPQIQQQGE